MSPKDIEKSMGDQIADKSYMLVDSKNIHKTGFDYIAHMNIT